MQLSREDDLLRPDSGLLFWLLLSALVVSSCTFLVLLYVLLLSDSTWESWQLRNRYANLWLALLLIYFTANSLSLILERSKRSRGQLVLHNAFHVLMLLVYVEMAASWDVYGRGDLALGSAGIVAVSILNVYIMVTKNVEHKRHHDQELGERTRLILSETSTRSIEGSRQSKSPFLRDFGHLTRVCVLLWSCLLLNGALHHGLGVQKWQNTNDSKVISVPSAMGFETRIFYECAGSDMQFPTIILEGGFDQGVADWRGVSRLLNNYDLRVCVWDKPGVGFSDYAYPREIRKPIQTYYDNLVRGLRRHEPDFGPPYVMVGFAEGAFLVKDFTLTLNNNGSNGDLVHSLILIEPEWLPGVRTDSESTLLNALGVPFGILDYLVRPTWVSADFWAREDRERRRWLETTEKKWVVRQFKNRHRTHFKTARGFDSGDEERFADVGVPVHVVMSAPSQDAIDRKCYFGHENQRVCDERRWRSTNASAAKGGQASNGGQVFRCSWYECDSNYFLYKNPLFTVDAIRTVIGHNDKYEDQVETDLGQLPSNDSSAVVT